MQQPPPYPGHFYVFNTRLAVGTILSTVKKQFFCYRSAYTLLIANTGSAATWNAEGRKWSKLYAVLRIRIRIRINRIHMFLGLPDPDPFVRGIDPNPDPSIIMKNSQIP